MPSLMLQMLIVKLDFKTKHMSEVIIIGGGLAGVAVASALAKRNISSTILEAEDKIATQASGNIAGIVMPHLTAKKNTITEFYNFGLKTLLAETENLKNKKIPFKGEQCGVIKFPSSSRLKQLYQEIGQSNLTPDFAQKLSKAETEDLVGFELREGGIFFKNAGWIEPASLCAATLKTTNDLVKIVTGQIVSRLVKEKNKWLALDEQNQEITTSEIIIVCSAYSCQQFEQLKFLPIEKVRGQVTHLKGNIKSNSLKHVLCYDGYLTPAIEGVHLLGATFNHGDSRLEVDAAQNINLLQRLHRWLPNFPISKEEIIESRVGFRTMAKGRLPIIGEIPLNSKNESGLYVSLAHAAKGLLSCNLAGEIIAQQICKEQSFLPIEILDAVSPLLWNSHERN